MINYFQNNYYPECYHQTKDEIKIIDIISTIYQLEEIGNNAVKIFERIN